mgnify:FL=1
MLPTAEMVRAAIESLYDGVATAKVLETAKIDTKTGRPTTTERTIAPFPCRLSYGQLPTTDRATGVAEMAQTVKLFCAPELVIPAGSDIEVKHRGRVLTFRASGVPAIYDSHQEIPLEHKERHHG